MWGLIRIISTYLLEKKADEFLVKQGLKAVGAKKTLMGFAKDSLTRQMRLGASNKLIGIYWDFNKNKLRFNFTLKHIQGLLKKRIKRHTIKLPVLSMWEWKTLLFHKKGLGIKNDKLLNQFFWYRFRKMSDRHFPIGYKIRYLFQRRDAIYSEHLIRALDGGKGGQVDRLVEAQRNIDYELIVQLMNKYPWRKVEPIFLERADDKETMDALCEVINRYFKRPEAAQRDKTWCLDAWESMREYLDNVDSIIAFIPYSPQTNNFGFLAIADLQTLGIWLTIRGKSGQFYKSPYIYYKSIADIRQAILTDDFGSKVFWSGGKKW